MDAAVELTAHFRGMAAYNRWANARLYEAAAGLPDSALHSDVGLYFKSLFGVLVHLLQTDRAWTFLLEGGALADMDLPAAPGEFPALRDARNAQDALFLSWMDEIDAAWLARPFQFASAVASWRGLVYDGTNASTLTHLFNHQTHHRGQAHSALSLLGVAEPPALDMLVKEMLGE